MEAEYAEHLKFLPICKYSGFLESASQSKNSKGSTLKTCSKYGILCYHNGDVLQIGRVAEIEEAVLSMLQKGETGNLSLPFKTEITVPADFKDDTIGNLSISHDGMLLAVSIRCSVFVFAVTDILQGAEKRPLFQKLIGTSNSAEHSLNSLSWSKAESEPAYLLAVSSEAMLQVLDVSGNTVVQSEGYTAGDWHPSRNLLALGTSADELLICDLNLTVLAAAPGETENMTTHHIHWVQQAWIFVGRFGCEPGNRNASKVPLEIDFTAYKYDASAQELSTEEEHHFGEEIHYPCDDIPGLRHIFYTEYFDAWKTLLVGTNMAQHMRLITFKNEGNWVMSEVDDRSMVTCPNKEGTQRGTFTGLALCLNGGKPVPNVDKFKLKREKPWPASPLLFSATSGGLLMMYSCQNAQAPGAGNVAAAPLPSPGTASKAAPPPQKVTQPNPQINSSYPPMPVKAPTQLGGASVLAKPAAKEISSYPPMSSKAPTPFGGTTASAKPVAKENSSYPPMASKAPTPFGGAPASAKPVAKESSSYPPMASTAPTPFGGAPASGKPAAKESSSYPPMASKAPTPFGGAPASGKPAAKESSSYPPMASKAPTPFGGAPASSKPVAKESSSYPPMASKAPTPFGGAPASGKPAAKASPSYPPMASKAPTPFGGGVPASGKPAAKESSNYPPMASNAPTPFGGGVPASTKPAAKASAPAKPQPQTPSQFSFGTPSPFGFSNVGTLHTQTPGLGQNESEGSTAIPQSTTTKFPPTFGFGANQDFKIGASIIPAQVEPQTAKPTPPAVVPPPLTANVGLGATSNKGFNFGATPSFGTAQAQAEPLSAKPASAQVKSSGAPATGTNLTQQQPKMGAKLSAATQTAKQVPPVTPPERIQAESKPEQKPSATPTAFVKPMRGKPLGAEAPHISKKGLVFDSKGNEYADSAWEQVVHFCELLQKEQLAQIKMEKELQESGLGKDLDDFSTSLEAMSLNELQATAAATKEMKHFCCAQLATQEDVSRICHESERMVGVLNGENQNSCLKLLEEQGLDPESQAQSKRIKDQSKEIMHLIKKTKDDLALRKHLFQSKSKTELDLKYGKYKTNMTQKAPPVTVLASAIKTTYDRAAVQGRDLSNIDAMLQMLESRQTAGFSQGNALLRSSFYDDQDVAIVPKVLPPSELIRKLARLNNSSKPPQTNKSPVFARLNVAPTAPVIGTPPKPTGSSVPRMNSYLMSTPSTQNDMQPSPHITTPIPSQKPTMASPIDRTLFEGIAVKKSPRPSIVERAKEAPAAKPNSFAFASAAKQTKPLNQIAAANVLSKLNGQKQGEDKPTSSKPIPSLPSKVVGAAEGKSTTGAAQSNLFQTAKPQEPARTSAPIELTDQSKSPSTSFTFTPAQTEPPATSPTPFFSFASPTPAGLKPAPDSDAKQPTAEQKTPIFTVNAPPATKAADPKGTSAPIMQTLQGTSKDKNLVSTPFSFNQQPAAVSMTKVNETEKTSEQKDKPFGFSMPQTTAAEPAPSKAPAPAAGASPSFNFGGFTSAISQTGIEAPPAPTPPTAGTQNWKAEVEAFYKKYNPSKLHTVDDVLTKYKGREEELMASLRKKYNIAANPASPVPVPSTSSSFGASPPTLFGAGAKMFQTPSTPATSTAAPAASPFLSTQATTPSPFGAQPKTPFGQVAVSASLSKATLFSTPSSAPFGTGAAPTFGSPSLISPAATPAFGTIGAPGGASVTPTFGTPFGSGSGAGPVFGAAPFGTGASPASGFGVSLNAGASAAPVFGAPSLGAASPGSGFGAAQNYRQKLVEFYTKHNPAKLGEVDATLQKYAGREIQLFEMLQKKYLKDGNSMQTTTGPTFGSPSFGSPGAFGLSSSFGSPAPAPAPAFGSGSAAPAFGSTSGLAAGSPFGAASMNPAFGQTSTPSFGSSTFGNAPAPAFGQPAPGGGFGAFASGGTGFGSIAGVSAPASNTFGASGGTGFGTFSSSSFTQMRK